MAMNAYKLPLSLVGPALCPQTGRDAVAQEPREVVQAMWADVAPELARLVAAMGIPADRVEDLVQEVFVAAWQQAPRSADRQQLKWWLIRVTTNRCNLQHRRQKRWRRLWRQITRWRSDVASAPHAASDASAREERDVVRQALENLPSMPRSVIVLRYFEGYDSKEIGRILNMPDSTVRSHLRKARTTLAMRLRQAGYENEEH